MATSINEEQVDIKDFSGATQRKSTKFLAKQNQVELSVNAQFRRIGGMEKIPGYSQLGNTITTSSTTSSSTSTSTSTTSTSTSTSSSTSTSTSTSSTTTP